MSGENGSITDLCSLDALLDVLIHENSNRSPFDSGRIDDGFISEFVRNAFDYRSIRLKIAGLPELSFVFLLSQYDDEYYLVCVGFSNFISLGSLAPTDESILFAAIGELDSIRDRLIPLFICGSGNSEQTCRELIRERHLSERLDCKYRALDDVLKRRPICLAYAGKSLDRRKQIEELGK